jgi:hypothetical protein
MSIGPRPIILLAALLILAGCPPASQPTPVEEDESPQTSAGATLAPVAGMVTGRISHADGRPLPDAHVLVIGVDYVTELDLRTNADGVYQGTIADESANYRLAAWVDAPFEGETYHFPLEPVGDPDTHFLGAEGLVKDFVWQLTGVGSWANELDPDDPEDRIAGSPGLYVYDPNTDPTGERALDVPIGSVVEITLRPLTALVDGSEAEPISSAITIEEEMGQFTITEVGVLSEIPIARYEVSATVTEPGGSAQMLLVAANCTSSECPIRPPPMAATAELAFRPANQSVHRRPFQGQPGAGIAIYVTLP